jgi:glyoxylase I family protein
MYMVHRATVEQREDDKRGRRCEGPGQPAMVVCGLPCAIKSDLLPGQVGKHHRMVMSCYPCLLVLFTLERAEHNMIRGALSHLDLTITDPDRAIPFYDTVLPLLGYRRVPVEPSTTAVACWCIADGEQSVFSIALERARDTGKQRNYDRSAPGLHHLAFHLDSRADVDQLYAQLVAVGITILDPLAEYSYTPGYYAISCQDPDGLVLECVYEPQHRGTLGAAR